MAKENNKGRSVIVSIAVVAMAFGLGDYEGHKAGYDSGQAQLIKAATMAQKLTSFIGTPTTTTTPPKQ